MSALDLNEREVRTMLRVTSGYGVDDVTPPLPWDLLRDLSSLVACDLVSVSGQDASKRAFFSDQEVGDDTSGEIHPPKELYWQLYGDCLACCYPDVSGDLVSVTMTSDFYSQRALHNTGMYVEFLRPYEHEMMVCIPSGPGRSLRLLFFRTGKGFSERDRALLTLLRPHLQAAYVAAERRRLGVAHLTPRQNEVLQYVAAGLSNGQIARRLSVSEGTVRKHLENVYARLDVTSRTAAVIRVGIEQAGG